MIVDVNVSLSRWPFRRIRGDETEELLGLLRRRGVDQAWAGSFDALFHKDVAGVNARLARECRERGGGLLLPFGTVNPKMPDWEDDLRRCVEDHRMPGIRLHPNYHGYALDDPDFSRLLHLAAQRRLLVQIPIKMEDERTMHPLVRVPLVDAAPLVDLVPKIPGLQLILLNVPKDMVVKLAGSGASFDIAMLEGLEGVARLAEKVGEGRVLFGSHAPFYIWESARLKVTEAGLPPSVERRVLRENALQLLEGRR